MNYASLEKLHAYSTKRNLGTYAFQTVIKRKAMLECSSLKKIAMTGSPLPSSWVLRLNVDAAAKGKTGLAGMGIIDYHNWEI